MDAPEVVAARSLAQQATALLERSPAFQRLDPGTRAGVAQNLRRIEDALAPNTANGAPHRDPYALALETPAERLRRLQGGGGEAPFDETEPANGAAPKKQAATQAIAARTGALVNEIDFPAFVASLVHGTFDAMVDASIRQMEAFADLVGAVAKDVGRFTSENVTLNQARDHLAQQYPRDLVLDFPDGQPVLRPRDPDADPPSWLTDYGLEDEPLTDELVEGTLVPAARGRLGEDRLQMLATMVLMGMNRINVKDGTISAKVRFRAAARDSANVTFATAQDPGGATWGARGGSAHDQAQMMISTVGANVQADADLRAELFGEVKINFVSETLPLDRFVDAAQLALLQRNANTIAPAQPAPAQAALPAAPLPASTTLPAAAAPATPAAPAAPLPAAPLPTS